ncbi:uncharacterized protein LACBIDRAFT_298077 [Laccaria bicolor S238N-H82]|uniref:Predicted protein n=1 Tax=Laccaria bicolor (strain S238N-H82 / ATCC MYA-4686) TaxID=486041 RepID=B0DC66_LACBS|nr:uncharacterized protein LACBIDRAFT_298077 [Laccaria bicolor S238N-H82]EDR07840.1 predicted protein [Laccaria bicolor S238N-H82]|eukprot:XP_001881629.1 predicted protein [Laccaria bicolor S238N-H82]
MFAVPTRQPEFFEPSTKCIVESVHEQRRSFAASDWLYTKVSEWLKPDGFTIIRPNNHVYVIFIKRHFITAEGDLVTKP